MLQRCEKMTFKKVDTNQGGAETRVVLKQREGGTHLSTVFLFRGKGSEWFGMWLGLGLRMRSGRDSSGGLRGV